MMHDIELMIEEIQKRFELEDRIQAIEKKIEKILRRCWNKMFKYKCLYCNKKFDDHNEVFRHQRKTHLGEVEGFAGEMEFNEKLIKKVLKWI